MIFYVWNLDGVLVETRSRLDLLNNKDDPNRFNKFHLEGCYGAVIEHNKQLFDACLKRNNAYNIILTGRTNHFRSLTEIWLKKHHFDYQYLFMRPDGDYTVAHEYKLNIIQRFLIRAKDNEEHLAMVFDDNENTVETLIINHIPAICVPES